MAKRRSAKSPRVYSYIRFSTPEQRLGDSERRQLEAAKSYADRHGLEFDKSPMMDEGRSAYHGHHRKKGHLGRFLELVESGKIPIGSILVVENIDRLSREDFMQAFATISQIITKGITIVTLMPEAEYNSESLKGGMIYQLVGQIQMAHEESLKKAERGKENWKQKRKLAREEKRILTRRCPNWLKPNDSGIGFEVIEGAAESIRMMFEMKLQGLGQRTSSVKLNAEAPWKPKNGWRASYVKKTLTNRSVIGDYQPFQRGEGNRRTPLGEPIAGYYPAIVESEVFFAVQENLKQNRGKAGRRDKASNLFTHIVKCAYCGGSMGFVDKGKPPKGQKYLRCDNGQRGHTCERHSIRYDECETAILENCCGLRPEHVLPDEDEQSVLCQSLKTRITGTEAELLDAEKKIANLVDRIADIPPADRAIGDRYQAKVRKLDERKAVLEKQRIEDQRALRTAERGLRSFKKWSSDFITLQKALTEDNLELRLRMRHHLRELIEKIEVFSIGWKHHHNGDGEDGERFAEWMESIVLDNFPELMDDDFDDFVDYVTQRRMSKEGRFLRIHFNTGRSLDVVPKGSLAFGVHMLKNGSSEHGREFIMPDTQHLWNEFRKTCRRRTPQ